MLFLSGIGPRVRGSKDIPGVTLDDRGTIVDVLAFLTNMKDDFATYNKVYAEYFAGDGNPNPSRTTIEIGSLPTPIAVEVKVTAIVE